MLDLPVPTLLVSICCELQIPFAPQVRARGHLPLLFSSGPDFHLYLVDLRIRNLTGFLLGNLVEPSCYPSLADLVLKELALFASCWRTAFPTSPSEVTAL